MIGRQDQEIHHYLVQERLRRSQRAFENRQVRARRLIMVAIIAMSTIALPTTPP